MKNASSHNHEVDVVIRGCAMLNRFVQWLSKVIPDVPEEIAVCEFDCREPECLMENWETCPRRLKGMSHANEKRDH